jgi:hypothetical protein
MKDQERMLNVEMEAFFLQDFEEISGSHVNME